jgi:serine/threonine-protein kinase
MDDNNINNNVTPESDSAPESDAGAAGAAPAEGAPADATPAGDQTPTEQMPATPAPAGPPPATPPPAAAAPAAAPAGTYPTRYQSAEEMRQDLERVATGADVAAAPAAPPKKRAAWPWIVLVIVLLALAGVALWYFFLRGDTEVPDLAGQTVEEAETTLTESGLALGDVLYNDNYPEGVTEGTVFEQSPDAGRMVDASSTVDVTIAGQQLAEVPDVTGMTETEATVAIRDAGFDLGGTEKEFNKDVPTGQVYDQAPKGGTEAPTGSPITIFVSEGVETVTIPNVVGMSESQAISTLEDANLTAGTTQEFSDKPVGEVINQSPAAGVNVDAGTKVTVTVSQGEQTVTMPNVIGMTENAATDALEDLGLRVTSETRDDAANAGKVVDQDPAPGTTLKPGDRVTIVVGEAPATP